MMFTEGTVEWYAEIEEAEKVLIHDILVDALAGMSSRVQSEVHIPGAVDLIHENITDGIEGGYPDIVANMDEDDMASAVDRYLEGIKFDLENR